MTLRIDHVVLWVEDPLRSIEFYQHTLGVEPVRVDEFRAGTVPFPSVRLSSESVLDLMPMRSAAHLNAIPGAEGSAGHKVNHVCLALDHDAWTALKGRLEAAGTPPVVMKSSFGARGVAPETFYFRDPDGNILEARYYG